VPAPKMLVPLLTLSGAPTPNNSSAEHHGDYNNKANSNHLVSINKPKPYQQHSEYDNSTGAVSSRSEANGGNDSDSPRGIGYGEGEKKKKGNKNNNKIPKIPNNKNNDEYSGRNGGQQAVQQSSVTKMPPVNNPYSNSARTGSRNGGPSDEIGSGESAGNVINWGFEVLDKGLHDNGPENEYSDDEDFEADGTDQTHNQTPYPPSGNKPTNGHTRTDKPKKKKKRKAPANNDGNDQFLNTTTLDNKVVNSSNTPRLGTLLPKI